MPLSKEEVRAAMLLKLEDSALNDCASELKLEPLTQDEATKKGISEPAGGFVIPYIDAKGRRTEFYRYRRLEEPARNGFSALVKHKEQKYTQPAKLTPRVYFCPLKQWREYLSRPEHPIYITEGELKAACAVRFGFPTVALGGVWNFRSTKANQPIIPDLTELNLKDNSVYIVFDSDAVTNPDVLKAENALARELLKLGARPYILRLPSLKNKTKTGLDDYLVARKEDSFIKLTENAEEWAPSAALHEFNERCVFLHDSSTVLEMETGNRWTTSKATKEVFAPLTYTVVEHRKKDAVLVTKRTATEWSTWPGRFELKGLDYMPGKERVTDNKWNTWLGWGVEETDIRRGDVSPWKELLEFIFKGHDSAHRKWFEQWIACPLQYPGIKLFTAVALWGIHQGTGKTLVGHTMQRIYGKNYTEVEESELHESFNEWAQHKQFALGEEITGGDKRGVADKLKGIITRVNLRVNAKFLPTYTINDCINWLFTSNHPDAFFLEDKDRRFFIVEIKSPPRENEFYRRYDRWYKSAEGIGALMYHLLHVDLTGFDPSAPAPMTESKREMIEMGRSDLDNFVAKMWDDMAVLKIEGKARCLWTTTELTARYKALSGNQQLTEMGMGRALKRAGRLQNTVRTIKGVQKLWLIHPHELIKDGNVPPAHWAFVYKQERDNAYEQAKEKHK